MASWSRLSSASRDWREREEGGREGGREGGEREGGGEGGREKGREGEREGGGEGGREGGGSREEKKGRGRNTVNAREELQ